MSRSATTAAEHGEGARGTYERLEAWLSQQEAGEESTAEPAIEQIEIVLEGRGVKLTMKAPIGDPDAAEAMAARLMRLIRDEG